MFAWLIVAIVTYVLIAFIASFFGFIVIFIVFSIAFTNPAFCRAILRTNSIRMVCFTSSFRRVFAFVANRSYRNRNTLAVAVGVAGFAAVGCGAAAIIALFIRSCI